MKTSSFLFVISSASTLLACTTSGGGRAPDGIRREIVGLEEMSLEYIQSHWGTPESSTPAGEGKTVRFKNIRTETEEPISGRMDVKFCDIKLELNKHQLVKSWNYETCRPQ